MVSTFTSNKRIEQPAHNDYVDSWDVPVNADWAIIDKALGSSVSVNLTGLSGNVTLTTAQYQPLKVILTGTPTGSALVRVPSGVGGLWVVRNNTSGGQAVTISSLAGGSLINVPAGGQVLVTCDGSSTGMFPASTTEGVAGSHSQVQVNYNGVFGASSGLAWDFSSSVLIVNSLSVTGATTLGNASTDILTINGTPVTAPNGLNINSNQLVLDTDNSRVGIGTASLGTNKLTVAGRIASTASGYSFPDNTVQTTAYQVQTRTVVNGGDLAFVGIPSNINNLEFAFALKRSTIGPLYVQLYRSGTAINAGYFSVLAYSNNGTGTMTVFNPGISSSAFLGDFGTITPITGKLQMQNIQSTTDTIGQGFYSGIQNNNSNYLTVMTSFGFNAGIGGPITGVRFFANVGLFSGRVTMTSTI